METRVLHGSNVQYSNRPSAVTYNSIQVLRCVAVVSVLLYHTNIAVDQDLLRIPFITDYGWMGVRLFFSISGFIIADRIHLETNLAHYLARRYLRVLPLYWLVTAIALVVSMNIGVGIFTIAQGGSVVDLDLASYFLKSLLIIPQNAWPVFAVGWSLEYEVAFYFFFGAAYFAGGRRGALTAMLILSVAGVAFPRLAEPFYGSMFLYFLLGCLAREILFCNLRPLISVAPLVCVVSGALWLLFLYGYDEVTETGFFVASAACFSSLIIICADLEKRGKLFQTPGVFELIGDMSYSIYLVHWFVMRTSMHLTRDVLFSSLEAELIRLATIVISLLASWAVWRFFEVPTNRLTHRLIKRH